ncbi:MAG: putative monovalent cation/H+ antiporter subunit A [Chloroflexaceae bacterium]|nr:putative monovalent cation/H+ antiporter subunit A [Chloroflexaceae bacterium]
MLSRLGLSTTQTKGSLAGWIIALLPLSFFVFFCTLIEPVAMGEPIRISYPWIPSLGVELSFLIDGLSLLFALIISGVGTFIIIYAGGYLAGHHQIGHMYTYLILFMISMLGLVLSDNIISLFVFWELTSITSYLLIGFKHEYQDSRYSALQALLVTGAGGLVLLAGLILLGVVGGSWQLSELFGRGEAIQDHELYLPMLILVLIGAFTKSAQFPFHFWLPNAMAAPTPVSAYLHSATMVKAGVFLLARLTPVLGGTSTWFFILTIVGGITMVMGAFLAIFRTDLKSILAYTTINGLGTLVFLLGLGTELAIEAAIVFLMVHSLYKGALFMVAGSVDHETGTRDIRELGGLGKYMPITAVAGGLAALSMMGMPPFLGFVGKEIIYKSAFGVAEHHMFLIMLAVLAMAFVGKVLTGVSAGLVTVSPFLGSKTTTPKNPHEAPISMWLGPVVLSALGLLLGLSVAFSKGLQDMIVAPAMGAVLHEHEVHAKLALWYGTEPETLMVFGLSMLTIVAAIGIYIRGRGTFASISQRVTMPWNAEQGYQFALNGMQSLARWQTRVLQHGYLQGYLLVVAMTLAGFGGLAFFSQVGLVAPVWSPQFPMVHEWLIAGMMLVATVLTIRLDSLLGAIVALGVVGYAVALIFILYAAPDLAITQFSIETLTVILFVLVLYRRQTITHLLEEEIARDSPAKRIRDLLIAGSVGVFITSIMLAITSEPLVSELKHFFAEESVPHGKGHNVVNVILIDFRGLDTMGEITVLGVAAIGVYSLIKLWFARDAENNTS